MADDGFERWQRRWLDFKAATEITRRPAERPAEPLTADAAPAVPPQPQGGAEAVDTEYVMTIHRFTRRLWHTSQHSQCKIWLAGRIQDDVNALRAAVGLPEFGWNDSVPDEEVGRCAVHVHDACAGQHTHNPPVRGVSTTTQPTEGLQNGHID